MLGRQWSFEYHMHAIFRMTRDEVSLYIRDPNKRQPCTGMNLRTHALFCCGSPRVTPKEPQSRAILEPFCPETLLQRTKMPASRTNKILIIFGPVSVSAKFTGCGALESRRSIACPGPAVPGRHVGDPLGPDLTKTVLRRLIGKSWQRQALSLFKKIIPSNQLCN